LFHDVRVTDLTWINRFVFILSRALPGSLQGVLGLSIIHSRWAIIKRNQWPDVGQGKHASLFRQFEFVRQQWINYGLDANAGKDTCPLAGNHSPGTKSGPESKFVISSDPKAGRPPRGYSAIRGDAGREYFFVPQHEGFAHDGHGRRRPNIKVCASSKGHACPL
jgi:hypothetical protein